MLFRICKQFFDKGLVGHRLAFRRKKPAEILLKGKQGFLRAPCGAYTLENSASATAETSESKCPRWKMIFVIRRFKKSLSSTV